MEMTHKKSKLAIAEFNEYWMGKTDAKTDKEFFELLILGVVAEQEKIDAAIRGKLAEGWKLSRLDPVLRAILRLGSFEILRIFENPAITIIDQYVSLTRDFFDKKQADFVNAALDKLARERRPGEFGVIADIGKGAE